MNVVGEVLNWATSICLEAIFFVFRLPKISKRDCAYPIIILLNYWEVRMN
jgi:hypothetical protein